MELQIDVLDAKPQRFEEAKAGAVQQGADEADASMQLTEDRPHLIAVEHGWEAARLSGGLQTVDAWEGLAEDSPVEEEERGKGLVLRRRGDIPIAGKVGEEAANIVRAELPWMTGAVEADEAPHPRDVRLFRPQAEMLQASRTANLVEEADRRHARLVPGSTTGHIAERWSIDTLRACRGCGKRID